jgi:outer membrane protein TolC
VTAASAQDPSETTAAPQVLDVQACISHALANSREVQDAQLGEKVADKQVREDWGAEFPEINATFQYTRNVTRQEGLFPDANNPGAFIQVPLAGDNLWNTDVVLEQPLFQAEAFVGVGAAGRFKDLQLERTRGTTQQIVTNVREAYYRALLASEDVRLSLSSISRVERTLDGARELEKAGLGNSYDVLRLDVELSRLRPVLRRAQNAMAAAIRDLKVAMGLDLDTDISLAGALHTIDLEHLGDNAPENLALLNRAGVPATAIEDLPRLLEIAEQSRSTLRQKQLDSRLAEAQLKATRATLYPKLLGFANYTVAGQSSQGLEFYGDASQRITNWQAGLRLEVPLLEGGARYARISQRSLQLQQSRTREHLEEQTLHNEIHTLLERLIEARDRVASQKRAVAQATRGFEIASTEFRMGINSQFNALDSEVALRETEFNYAEAVFEVLVAQARLDRAVGLVPMMDDAKETP